MFPCQGNLGLVSDGACLAVCDGKKRLGALKMTHKRERKGLGASHFAPRGLSFHLLLWLSRYQTMREDW